MEDSSFCPQETFTAKEVRASQRRKAVHIAKRHKAAEFKATQQRNKLLYPHLPEKNPSRKDVDQVAYRESSKHGRHKHENWRNWHVLQVTEAERRTEATRVEAKRITKYSQSRSAYFGVAVSTVV